MRENRGYYRGSVVGCVSSFCWIIKRKDWLFGVEVAQTGWTTYICVSLVLCVFYVYISAIFYVFHCSVIYNFLTVIAELRLQLSVTQNMLIHSFIIQYSITHLYSLEIESLYRYISTNNYMMRLSVSPRPEYLASVVTSYFVDVALTMLHTIRDVSHLLTSC